MPHNFFLRSCLFLAGIVILAAVYIFQRTDAAGVFGDFPTNTIFALNRTIRLILNDVGCLLIILAVFREKKYLQVAFGVFLIELFALLPVYLLIKLSTEGDSEISSPLLSQIHRLIVNPMLMILLIAGFFYQRFRTAKKAT